MTRSDALGSEAQLIERYGVGRPVLREAFRVLESRWAAKPRPGPGAGLVVTAPQPSAFRDTIRLFMDYEGFVQQDLYDVWETLEVAAVEQLARQSTTRASPGYRVRWGRGTGRRPASAAGHRAHRDRPVGRQSVR